MSHGVIVLPSSQCWGDVTWEVCAIPSDPTSFRADPPSKQLESSVQWQGHDPSFPSQLWVVPTGFVRAHNQADWPVTPRSSPEVLSSHWSCHFKHFKDHFWVGYPTELMSGKMMQKLCFSKTIFILYMHSDIWTDFCSTSTSKQIPKMHAPTNLMDQSLIIFSLPLHIPSQSKKLSGKNWWVTSIN